MTEDTIAWLHSAHGDGLLAMIHMGGMAFAAGAAVLGYGIAAQLLFRRGRQPAAILINALHGLIAISLVVLWLTGGALTVGRMSLTELPAVMIFKVGVAALLSLSIWAEHAMARPWLLSAHRPLAANLGWGQLIGIAAIGGLSLSCWAMLIAGKYLPQWQALPLERSFALLGLAVGVIAAGCLAMILVTRVWHAQAAAKGHAARRSRPARKKRSDGRRSQPPATGQPVPQQAVAQLPGGHQAGVRPALVQRGLVRQPPLQPLRPQSPMPSSTDTAAVAGFSRAPEPAVLLVQQPAAQPSRSAMSALPVDATAPISEGTTYQVPQGRTDEAEQLRYKLAREWLRCTPARPASPAWNATPEEADDRLLQDWLRRP